MTELIENAPADARGSSPSSGARGGMGRVRERGAAWWPILIGLGLSFVATLSWLQWRRPYLEHDDWDLLLPDNVGWVVNHAERLLMEGHWLNYPVWRLGAQSLSDRDAVILFAVGWMISVAFLVRAFDLGWWSVLAVPAVAAAPMISDISYWPATTAAPMWVLALTLAGLWFTRDRLLPHLAILMVGTGLVVLGYPALALVLLAFLVAVHHAQSWKRLFVVGLAFAAAYVGAVLFIFALNQWKFGVFGLEVQAWRHPTPLDSMSALGDHLRIVRHNWTDWLRMLAVPLIAAGGVAALAMIVQPRLRRRALVLAVAFAGGAALTSASTITEGVGTPFRSLGWTWPLIVLLVVWAIQAAPRRTRLAGIAALAVVAVWSTTFWAHGASQHYQQAGALKGLENEIVDQRTNGEPVVFALRPDASPFETISVLTLLNSLAKNHDIPHARLRVEPQTLADYIREHRITDPVFHWQGRLVVQVPYSVYRWEKENPPRWLVPWRE